GTPDYIAPEQARDSRHVDARADIYSLGCTFYHLLAGRPPFPEGAFIEKLLMHQLDPPEMLEKLRPEVPGPVVAIVNKMMAKKPADRFQTAEEVAHALAAVPGPGGRGAATLLDAVGVRPPSTAVCLVTPATPSVDSAPYPAPPPRDLVPVS